MKKQNTKWDTFFQEKVNNIFHTGGLVIDIGGGLRVDPKRNNRFAKDRQWILPLLSKVTYKILDPVETYHPDIIGDIHNLPLDDDSVDSIFCLAVLEHVENPIKAMEEMRRVLKKNGQLFIYVPFLYYYHAEKGYYGDYWRFTEDTLKMFGKSFSNFETVSLRGAIETWIKISPLGRYKSMNYLARTLDQISGKKNSNQVSGYYAYYIK